MNAIIADFDRIWAVCPLVSFAQAAVDRFAARWLDMWAVSKMASADEAMDLERDGEPVTPDWVMQNAEAIFDASVRKACGLPTQGGWVRKGW